MIQLRDVRFRWNREGPLLLDIPTFKVEAGEKIFLEGPSGSGKTSLLNILGAISSPEHGSVEVNGTDVTQLTGAARDSFRADHIGIIFQMFNLIPYLSPLDNIILPCRFSERRNTSAIERSNVKEEGLRLLSHMQLNDVVNIDSPALELSVGQQQRVAAARSLIGSPELIIADEPTSALDHDIREVFLNLLFEEVANAGITLLFVSHDASLAGWFDRRIKLNDINEACIK